ncbi:hypothetical protein N0V83_005367 [Neocucurbitaria cava]|uniref:Uncharacterized protein n=1 Tax=Neocucurbitaria cava TaxID=798079 RepID=A0A9W8Y9Y2_9PLEO|nr:hypothetical protein N0V83_005367 [Neocucurbitaria cava]
MSTFRIMTHRKPEHARALFKKADFLRSLGSDDYKDLLDEATKLTKEAKPELESWKQLGLKDFDDVVSIWSR